MLEALKFLWPFIKEMILGDKTLGQAVKTNKMRLVLLFAIMGSFAANGVVIPRLLTISTQYVELQKEQKKECPVVADDSELRGQYKDLKTQFDKDAGQITGLQSRLEDVRARNKFLVNKVLEYVDGVPYCKQTTQPPPQTPAARDRYENMRRQLEKMKKDEAG